MKKLILFAAATAAITTFASAQIRFGVKAGLNLANVSVSPKQAGESYSMKTSFNGGAFASVPLFSNFSLQPELMYSGQGSKITSDGDNFDYNLGYINVPVLFKYNDPSGFFAEIGPQIGFLASAKGKANGITVDIKDQIKSTDFSGVIGLGYLSSINLGVNARYNLGFSNINKDASTNTTVKNGVIQIGVFYMFGEGQRSK